MTQKKIKLKTINNQQLVGDGNITIESASNVDIVTNTNGWNSTTSDSKVPSEKLVKNSLDNKLDKTHSSYKGKNVVTNSSTGAIEFEDKPTIPSASSTTPSADTQNGSYGSGTSYARSNHTHPKSSLYAEATHTHTKSQISDFPSLSTVATSGSYTDLSNKPTIPSATSDLTNDSGFLTSHQDISGKEDTTNKVTSLSSSSTDTQYPTAKAVYDNLALVDSDDNEFQLVYSATGNNQFYTSTSAGTTPFTYNGDKILVDWGDGTTSEYRSGQCRHNYSESGDYTITFKGNITKLNDGFMNGISNVIGVKFSSTIKSLGVNTFCNTGLTSVEIPPTLTSQGNSAFWNCASLSTVKIPSTMTDLGNGLFTDCTSLTNINIPEGVTNVGNNTFTGCTNLKTVEIPSTMTSMGYSTFQNCTSLESVRFNSETPPTLSSSSNIPFWGNVPTTCKIIVPSSKIDAYKSANNYPDPDVYEYVGWADYVTDDVTEYDNRAVSSNAVYDEIIENTYKQTVLNPFNASMWQDVDGGTQTVSTTSSTVYNSGVNRQAMINEFTDSDKYVLEFDFITTVRTRVGLLFGVDETQTRNGYVLATDIQNTWVDNDSTLTTVAEMDSNKFLQNTTQHIKFVRDGNIAKLYLDNELMYTITDMNNHYNRIGLWKWSSGTITLSNFVLKTPQGHIDNIIPYQDLNDYNHTGFYACNLPSADLQTLQNCPVTDGFSLLVEENKTFNNNGFKQTLTTWGRNGKPQVYIRTYVYDDIFSNPAQTITSGWQLWYEDTGWQNVTFSSGFSNYSSSGTNCRYRRIGKIVHLEGIFKNTNAISSGNSTKMGTISDTTCRPPAVQYSVQQGSSLNRFAMSVATDGSIYIQRYGTTADSQVTAGAWLHCYMTWFVD